MEDIGNILYIILVIGAVILNIVRQSQKNKKNIPPVQRTKEKNVYFEDIFETITDPYAKEEVVEEVYEPIAEPASLFSEQEQSVFQRQQEIFAKAELAEAANKKRQESYSRNAYTTYDDEEKGEIEEDINYHKMNESFSLKHAIIYSEIINRKY